MSGFKKRSGSNYFGCTAVLLIAVLIIAATAHAGWTWVSGSNIADQYGIYGTKGVADANNAPGASGYSSYWKDSSSNMWLFGGYGYAQSGGLGIGWLNDLWKYNPSSGLWTWVHGYKARDMMGTYGTKGVASHSNIPGGRQSGVSWIDASGNLWLFGGLGLPGSGSTGLLNDLWKFNGTDWTWVSGSNTTNQHGIYGTKGLPDANNVPGAREAGISWIDASSNLWLFGGRGYAASGNWRYLNDLWKYDLSGGLWTWVSGSNATDQSGVYGTKEVADSNNIPGARNYSISWTDTSGNLWLFGGWAYDASGSYGRINDLWKYNLSSGLWAWVSGSNATNQPGVYGTKGAANSNNVPGAREYGASWKDASNSFWLFGGYGVDANGYWCYLNDMWKFDGVNWTWVGGSNAVNQNGVYGTKGLGDLNNLPGARDYSASWIDASGNLWLWGGQGYDASGGFGMLNDLWKLNVDAALQPFPEHNASIGTEPNGILVLNWKPGRYANKHNVYYGTNFASLPEVSHLQDANNYTVNTALNVTYYWRIDEVNSTTGNTVTGDIWKFTVDHLNMETFEGYADTNSLQATWTKIDGIVTINATSDVNDYTVSISHSGLQAMRVRYNLQGSGGSSAMGEVYRQFIPPKDWTESATGGAKALRLWIRGMGNNRLVKKMYVVLTDSNNIASNTIYHPNANAVATSEKWVAWNIKLSDFENGSFNLSAVKKIYIGVDNRNPVESPRPRMPTSGSDDPNVGYLFMDDAALNPSGCVPEIDLNNPDAPTVDITNDCNVGFADLAMITADWTRQDSNVVPNGVLTNSPTWAPTGGKFSGAVVLDGFNDWVDIDDLALPHFSQGTVAFWVKRNGAPPQNGQTYIFGTSDKWRVNIRLINTGAVQVQAVCGNGVKPDETAGFATTDIYNQTWTHIALRLTPVLDVNDAVDCTLYVDGEEQGTKQCVPFHYYTALQGGLQGVCIGALNNGLQQWANVAVDDFRIYNVDLSESDIGLLADNNINTNPAADPNRIIMYDFNEPSGTVAHQSGSISGVYHPVAYVVSNPSGSQGNIYTKESQPPQVGQKINLRDYARLAKYWQYTIPNWP